MAIINGTNGDDLLFALASGDILNALQGNDLLITEGFDFSTLDGGPGNDSLWLSPLPEIHGPAEHNVLNGGEGSDLFGGTGNGNVLNGETGDDRFEITGNGNILNGGEGDDTVGVTDDATFYVTGNGNILNGGEGNDWVGVAGDANILNGGEGLDLLAVRGSSNILNGDAGNDQFYCDTGDGNILNGGEGDDVYSGVNFNNNIFNGDSGNDYASAAIGNHSVLNGGEGDDFLAVGGDHNTLNGGAGNDILEAFFEASPQPGTNVLLGGDGDDVLTAWFGGNLTGGGGSDRFIPIGTGVNTVITDFEHDTHGGDALRPEDVLSITPMDLDLDRPLNALVGQGYLVVDASTNVSGGAAADTVVQIDADGRAGPSAPATLVTLLDTTLTTHGADANNWLVG